MSIFLIAFTGCAVHDETPVDPVIKASVDAPAMCPWREPEKDMARFFPGSTEYSRETLILSSLRLEIMKRLGKGVTLESNSLYAYRIKRGKQTVGTVLVRRTAGEFGGIEIVLAVGPDRRVVGVRLQRHREPPVVAKVLDDPKWLEAFNGKAPGDKYLSGADLPFVDTDARKSADAVGKAVRSLLIEYDTEEAHRLAARH